MPKIFSWICPFLQVCFVSMGEVGIIPEGDVVKKYKSERKISKKLSNLTFLGGCAIL